MKMKHVNLGNLTVSDIHRTVRKHTSRQVVVVCFSIMAMFVQVIMCGCDEEEEVELSCGEDDVLINGDAFTYCGQCPDEDSCSFNNKKENTWDKFGHLDACVATVAAECKGEARTCTFNCILW